MEDLSFESRNYYHSQGLVVLGILTNTFRSDSYMYRYLIMHIHLIVAIFAHLVTTIHQYCSSKHR